MRNISSYSSLTAITPKAEQRYFKILVLPNIALYFDSKLHFRVINTTFVTKIM